MADICSLCKKKIGILDKSGAKTYPGGVVCGSCVKQINKALSVYYQNLDGYTLTQLEVVYSHISELLVHGTELKKINSRYDEIIAPVKTKLRKCEFDLPALKQTIAKESQKRRSECQKEMEQLNREEGRDSDGKKIRWNTEEREMLKEQKYYLRKGMKLEADNIDAIFARQDDTYWKFIQGLAEELEKGEKSGNLILESAEKEIEYLQMLVALNNGMRICERFVYAFNSAPAEKELFGFTGKNETQSKELADAVKIIAASIKDTLGSQTVKNYNLSELSYKQLAQMYRDYIEVMEDCDAQVVRAKGLFESQTFGLKANEVWGNPEHVEPDRETNRILSENLKKCQAAYNERRSQLQQKYILFLRDAFDAKGQSEKESVHTTPQMILPMVQDATPAKTETTVSVEKSPTISTEVIVERGPEKVCPSCKKGNKTTARFCAYCGSSLEVARFCTQCGTKLRPGKKFCSGCGAKIE